MQNKHICYVTTKILFTIDYPRKSCHFQAREREADY